MTALCPTFRHPELLANSIELWNRQDYPVDRRELIILDDAGTYKSISVNKAQSWRLYSMTKRIASLPGKYNILLNLISSKTNNVLVWEDDDIYLKNYVSTHAEVLKTHELSKPSRVRTDCGPGGAIQEEGGKGRFHSNMGFTRDLITRIGGWVKTDRQDFDLQLIAKLYAEAKSVGEWDDIKDIPFIYCWNTGQAHCQWTMDGDGKSETWYQKAEQAYKPVPYVGEIVPKLDERTTKILEQLGELN